MFYGWFLFILMVKIMFLSFFVLIDNNFLGKIVKLVFDLSILSILYYRYMFFVSMIFYNFYILGVLLVFGFIFLSKKFIGKGDILFVIMGFFFENSMGMVKW